MPRETPTAGPSQSVMATAARILETLSQPQLFELKRQSRERDQDRREATPAPAPPPTPDSTSTAPHPPSLVGKALVVDQDAQVLRIYEDGVEIRTVPVSTGLPPLYTPAFRGFVGHYVKTIYSYGSWADNAWYIFRGSGNIYFHSAPYQTSEDGETRTYGGLDFLGVRPSSHGCIRLHPADAEWLTRWNPRGVPILITPLDLSREW